MQTNVCTADVAQLVAHHLAKVRVASSSLVIRSTQQKGVHLAGGPFLLFPLPCLKALQVQPGDGEFQRLFQRRRVCALPEVARKLTAGGIHNGANEPG